jgi:tetratricopeptide (TPR) repeat protein
MAEQGSGEQGRRRPRKSKAPRRWCLPPAIVREPGEMLEGSHVLEELGGETSLVLWSALRDVSLWASTPPERRGRLFSPTAEANRRSALTGLALDPAVELSLTALSAVVSHTTQANPEITSLVCMELSRWARRHGAMGTAVSFAQAAAFALPQAPAPALEVGLLALEWGRLRRSETWLRRTIGLARRARDWEGYGKAYAALGEVYRRSDRPEDATRFFQQAVRVCRRHGVLPVRAEALHGLMRISMAAGELEAADQYARAAQRGYGRGHPALGDLLHDITGLMVARGQYERAVPLLRRQLAATLDPARRMTLNALLARAAAELGDPRTYEQSWAEAWALLDNPASVPDRPETLLHLGKAAAAQKDWLRVQQIVQQFGSSRVDAVAPSITAALAELELLARNTGRRGPR